MSKMFSFISATCNPIAGGPCPYDCSYCWATALKKRFGHKKYVGEYRLEKKELRTYAPGSFVFVQDMSDIGDPKIPRDIIQSIFSWMQLQPEVNFLLLTKNPKFYQINHELLKPNMIIGTTIESDIIPLKISKAPHPYERKSMMVGMKKLHPEVKRFVSIEPIMAFTPNFLDHIDEVSPEFVAVGYDNYDNQLPEPTLEKTEELIRDLSDRGIRVYRKTIREANRE